ncbi:MAG: PAS domain S-box protein [Nitrospiraceae bacterium]|nr:MAG: PAS domain S-box protein [Nitrospiraceae bacterium]
MSNTSGQKTFDNRTVYDDLKLWSGPAPRNFANPVYILVILTVSIFLAELVIEFSFKHGEHTPTLFESFLSGLLLVIVIFPALYILMLRPMRTYIAQYEKTTDILRESEEKFRNLAEKSPNMIFINQKGKVVYANQICEEIMGYRIDELCSPDFNILDLIAPESIDVVKENMKRHMNGEDVPVYDYSLIARNGGKVEAMIATKLIRYEGEAAVLGIVTDITDRKRAEDAYQERDQELSAIIESSTDGILVVDREGRVIHTNRKFGEMWCIPDEIIETRSDEKLLNHVLEQLEDPKAFISKISRLYGSEESGFDILFFKDGRVFERHSNPLILKGSVSGRVWAFRDISERVKSEEALINARQEIEAWNRELEKRVRDKTDELSRSQTRLLQAEKLSVLGQLAACLAHELNSPLAGLLPLIDKYRKKAAEGSEMYREMTLMHNAGEYMAKIVKNFGSFSRVGSSGIDELNLNDIIEDTLSFSTGRMEQSGIKVIRKYAEDLPRIRADRTGLQQVVLNIVANARDAMPGGGTFIITTGFNNKENLVIMEFTDDGEGIREEILGRIFDPFFTTKKHGEGVGLGLSVTYGIIRNYSGEISVESTPGRGTKFKVLLPVNNI